MKSTVLRVKPSNFEAMLDKAKSIFSGKGDQEVTLSFAGGEYRLNQPIAWDAADFPGKSHLRMIGGDRIKTVFSAWKELEVSAFAHVAGKPYCEYRFPKNADGSYPKLRTLYADGKMAEVARSSEYRSTPPFTRDGVEYQVRQKDFNEQHWLYVPRAAIDEAGIDSCIGAELHIRVEWEFKVFHIVRIDLEKNWVDENGQEHVAMHLDPREMNNGNLSLSMCKRVFFISNTASCLTKPGHYVYVPAEGRLLYIPEGEITDHRFAIGAATNLFSLNNFESIALNRLTFTGIEDEVMTVTGYYAAGQSGRWRDMSENANNWAQWFQPIGAVKIRNVNRLDAEDCTFTELPCDAFSLQGVLNRVTVHSCRFTHIGGSAIRVGHPRPWAEDNQITDLDIVNNYLSDIGHTYENSSSILVTKAKNARINHNTILRSSYSAVSAGWLWDVAEWEYGQQVNLENVEIAYNYIQSFVMNMRDGGGIYTLGGNVTIQHEALMNRLHDNYVVEDELTCPENGFFASLYHDGASSNWHTFNNVVVHNPTLNGSTASYSARIYLQGHSHLVGQASTWNQSCWHIFCENNFICCCKNFGEVYRSQAIDPEKAADRLDDSRHLREKNTHLLKSARDIKKHPVAAQVVAAAGCEKAVRKG